jgi:hypothetical protein
VSASPRLSPLPNRMFQRPSMPIGALHITADSPSFGHTHPLACSEQGAAWAARVVAAGHHDDVDADPA